MNQALRIIMSAVLQMEADPVQAARALSTQARLLIEMSAGQEQLKRLGVAAGYMQTYLNDAARKGAPLVRAQVERPTPTTCCWSRRRAARPKEPLERRFRLLFHSRLSR